VTPIRPAATVLVMRDSAIGPEVLMVRRRQETAFMGGAHVFPGGAVDATDRDRADPRWCDGVDEAVQQLSDLFRSEALAFAVAAVRELFEEAGILLARRHSGGFVELVATADQERFKEYRLDVHQGRLDLRTIAEREHLRLALDVLVAFAHWVTPSFDTRRFDTRFFMTRMPPNQVPVPDETETTHSEWVTAAGALAAATRGEIVLPPPTWVTLRDLEEFATVESAIEWAHRRKIQRSEPRLIETGEARLLVIPGDPEHPETGVSLSDGTSAESGGPRHETRFVWTDGRWRPIR
jgi:8-oxo-dGTP pyrophosphatase MutT (NUDIX family)